MGTVRVARIGKPHGIRGEVTVELFTDSPTLRFAPGNRLGIARQGWTPPPYTQLTVKSARWHKKVLLLTFEECMDRNTAETLRDYYLYAEALDAAEDEDAWYADDLLGFTVHIGTSSSPSIGVVSDLITRDAQDLLVVHLADSHEVLLPFVDEIVPVIDESEMKITITPPPGLLELNQD